MPKYFFVIIFFMNLISFRKIPLKVFIFCAIFTLSFHWANTANADTSNISKIVFITPEQTIKPNEISKEITIQIQDASGNKVSALETIRFDAFQSTSPTGVFVSCTTPANPPTDYLSKNGSNKNICYKDSTEGVYTITAKTTNTVNPLSVSQTITVSSAGNSSSSANSDTASSSVNTTSSTSQTSMNDSPSSGTTYVYSSSVALSTYEPISLNVEAGRERIAFLHSPIEFKARAFEKKSGKDVSGARYSWAFGDGTSLDGEMVSHAYAFPGDYNVVLNSYSGSEEAVDVTKVKVVEAKVAASYTDTYLELANQNTLDVNVGGWKIKDGDKEYIIPRDTIISGKSSIKIPRQVLGRVGESAHISVTYPDDQTVSELALMTPDDKQKIVAELSAELAVLESQLAQASVKETQEQIFASGESSSRLVSESDIARNKEEESKSENISVANPVQAEVSHSLMSKLFDFFATMFR